MAIDQTVFNENLLLTQAYCELQLKNTDNHIACVLRSFNPVYNGREIMSFKFEPCFSTTWNPDPIMSNNNQLYEELFEKQIRNKKDIIKQIDAERQFKGRILIAEVDLTVVDGASEAESEGIIDWLDCPPIDTWFYMSENSLCRVLFAWIPEQFVDLVEKGIRVNPVDCIYWAADCDNSRYNKPECSENTGSVMANKSNALKTFWIRVKNMFWS